MGKKLDFLVQEMNREANTIGSKANDMEITSLMLETKSGDRKNQGTGTKYRITVNTCPDDKAYKCYNNQLDELRYWIVFGVFQRYCYFLWQKASCLLFQDLPEREKGRYARKSLIRSVTIELSVSMTTRQPRQGEIDKVHYHLVTKNDFDQLIEEDGFMEYANVYGNYYGTPRAQVMESAGHRCYLGNRRAGRFAGAEKLRRWWCTFSFCRRLWKN